MTNEKWWLANAQLQHLLTQVRTVEQDVLLDDIIPDIVAEATRRGEVKTWEEAKELAKDKIGTRCHSGEHDIYYDLFDKAIEAKLTSLKTP